jgi:hypothetical protein
MIEMRARPSRLSEFETERRIDFFNWRKKLTVRPVVALKNDIRNSALTFLDFSTEVTNQVHMREERTFGCPSSE